MNPGARHLLLVTTAYPSGLSETFLEPEIPVIAETFDKVTVLMQIERQANRDLPSNFELSRLYSDRRWKAGRTMARLRALWKGMWRPAARAELWDALTSIRQRPGMVHRRLAEWYRGTYRSEMFADVVAALPDPPTVCYHYWFTPEVRGTVMALERMGLRGRVPVVVRAHGGDLYDHIQPSHYFSYRREITRSIDWLCPVSDAGRRYLAQRHPAETAKIRVERLGVAPAARQNQQPQDGLSLVSVSSIIPIKRLDRIVTALEQLGRRFPELGIRWTHVGDGPLRADIERMARGLPSNVQVEFLGQMSNEKVFEVYEQRPFDALVNTSESEGIPVSMMEAFARGVPVIGPSVGGVPEILGEAGGILLPEPLRTEDLVAAMARFIDKTASGPIRTRAYETWRMRYDANRNFAQFAQLLLSTAAAKAGQWDKRVLRGAVEISAGSTGDGSPLAARR